MANERKTEIIVREKLRELGYFDDENIIVEEQKSDSIVIDKLLKNASKKWTWKWYPEFIIRSKENTDFLIVIECKADIKKHKSETLNKYSEYAVDWVLLYWSFLSKEFDVLSIAVSWESMNELKVTQLIQLKNWSKYYEYFGSDFLSFDDYYNSFLKSDIKFNQDYIKLLDYTKNLNDNLHSKKIKESQRSLLISWILIALQNKAFKNSFTSHKKPEQLAKNLISTITDEFVNANLPEEKIKNLNQAFSFILTHTTLTTDKEFFEQLIKDIDVNINNFMRTHKYFDTLWQFYIEFLRYANNDKWLWIVLTPPHITEIFSDLAGVDKDSIVFDNCCWTSGFLISAMKKMVNDANWDSKKILNIKKSQLIWVEYQDDIYALWVSNIIIHWDWKTNIILWDCFKESSKIKEIHSPNIWFLNPPYKSKSTDIEELDFVINNLNTLRPEWKCISIIPLSCAISQDWDVLERKKKILEEHTLEAVMSMPEDLFHNSKVNVVTCILVITAHKPHPKWKKTWLWYWRDDWFVKTKWQWRIDLNNTWNNIKTNWINSYINKEVIDWKSVMRELNADDEWCAETYLETNYNSINYDDFLNYTKRYLAYRLLNNLLNFKLEKKSEKIVKDSKLVPLTEIFDVYNWLASSQVDVKDFPDSLNDIRYIRPSQSYEWSIAWYVDSTNINEKYIFNDNTIYVSTDWQWSHTYSYVSSFQFVPNSNVSVLIPKKTMTLEEKIYYSICITKNRYKFSYGRKPKWDRLKMLLIPSSPPNFVYNDIFNEIFTNWKTIIK